MPPRRKMLLIVNPVSGRMTLRPKLWQILNLFCSAGMEPTVLFTQKRGDARVFAAACPADTETVVCAGGDGTLNEVISGLMGNPSPHTLGYLPVGTTNDLANSLGLSKGAVKAAEDIIEGHTCLLDIGSFSGRYFNYIASFGAFTEASYNATQEAKNLLGHAAYLLEGIMSLGNIRPYHVTFAFDGQCITSDFIFAAVANTTSLGGVLKLSDQLVAFNDGKFEVLLIRAPDSLARLQKIIGDLLSQHFSDDDVSLYHTSRLRITTDEEIDWTLDGEHQVGSPVVEIENIPNAVRLIVPRDGQKEKIVK